MNSTSLLVYYILIAFFIAMAISYGVYLFIYLHVRKLINKTYFYQERYKEYAIISFASLIKPLELLSKAELASRENLKFKNVIRYMNDYDEQYRNQLSEIWQAINQLSNLKLHFNFVQVKKMFQNIDEQFKKLDLWIQDFKDLTKNASGYQNDASKIMVKYRFLVDELLSFLTNHILTKYDSPVFKEFISNISKNFESANFAFIRFQNSDYLKAMEQLRYSIYTLLSYVNRLYVLDQKNDYLKFLIREIEFLYNEAENENNLSNLRKLNEIYRTIIDAREGISKVDRDLHILQFKEAELLINNLLKVLQPLRASLVNENQAKNIINLGIANFVKGVDTLEQKRANLVFAIKELHEIFSNNPNILSKIDAMEKIFNSTRKSITNLQKFYLSERKDNYGKLLEKMTHFIDLIEKLKEEIDSLIHDIYYEITLYKNTVHKINDLNLKYLQLHRYISDNKILLPKQLMTDFENCKNEIYEKTMIADKNYRNIAKNLDEYNSYANDLFVKTLKWTIEQITIKKMSELLMMFLNKYRHESLNIHKHISIIEKLYKNSQYEQALKHAIITLTAIKKSAESNNLTLS